MCECGQNRKLTRPSALVLAQGTRKECRPDVWQDAVPKGSTLQAHTSGPMGSGRVGSEVRSPTRGPTRQGGARHKAWSVSVALHPGSERRDFRRVSSLVPLAGHYPWPPPWVWMLSPGRSSILKTGMCFTLKALQPGRAGGAGHHLSFLMQTLVYDTSPGATWVLATVGWEWGCEYKRWSLYWTPLSLYKGTSIKPSESGRVRPCPWQWRGWARPCCCWSTGYSVCCRYCGLHCCSPRPAGTWGLAAFPLFLLCVNRCTTRPPSGVLRSQMLQMQCPSRLGCPDRGKWVEKLDSVP